jgi:hydrogenase maturation protease
MKDVPQYSNTPMLQYSSAPSLVLVIGVGNDYAGDDAVGRIVARRLTALNGGNIRVVEESGEGAELIEIWRGADFVIVIDAVSSGGAPGTIHCFDTAVQPIPAKFFHHSTHAFSLAEAIGLARALKQLPNKLVVYGIEGKNFESGAELSMEAEAAVDEVIGRIREELSNATAEPSSDQEMTTRL